MKFSALPKPLYVLFAVFALADLMLVAGTCSAATALNLQQCSALGSGGLMGCPTAHVSMDAVAPTTLVRSIVANAQGWRTYSTLMPTDTVYGADGQWHVLNTITVATRTTPTTPVSTTCPDTFVAVTWTCTASNGTATCTAPLK
jgi:hypothetical protein